MQPPGGKRSYDMIVADMLQRLLAGSVLTDTNKGSVVRTLVEAFSREMAEAYAKLDMIYERGFIDTAVDDSLDHLVAIMGQARLDSALVMGEAVFARDSRVKGRIVIPNGTELLVQKAIDKEVAYRTIQESELASGQSVITVPIACEVPKGQTVDDVMLSGKDAYPTKQVSFLAGIGEVTITRSTSPRGYRESDDELRKRVKGLINAVGGGTYKAIEQEILATGKVSGVVFRDADSDGVPKLQPGELEIAVDVTGGDLSSTDVYAAVLDAIHRSKGPGISVRLRGTTATELSFRLKVKLANANVSLEKRETIRRAIEDTVTAAVGDLQVGTKLAWNPLMAKVLTIDGVQDFADGSAIQLRDADGKTEDDTPSGDIPKRLIDPLERLILARSGSAVTVSFEGESLIYVQLIADFREGDAKPDSSLKFEMAKAIEDKLREKNGMNGNRTLSWKEVVDAAWSVPGAASIPRNQPRVRIAGVLSAGELELSKEGQSFNLGPDDVLAADPNGPSWGG